METEGSKFSISKSKQETHGLLSYDCYFHIVIQVWVAWVGFIPISINSTTNFEEGRTNVKQIAL